MGVVGDRVKRKHIHKGIKLWNSQNYVIKVMIGNQTGSFWFFSLFLLSSSNKGLQFISLNPAWDLISHKLEHDSKHKDNIYSVVECNVTIPLPTSMSLLFCPCLLSSISGFGGLCCGLKHQVKRNQAAESSAFQTNSSVFGYEQQS